MGKNVSLDLTGEFAVKGAAISSNSKLPDGATELLKDHVGDLNQHVNAAIKQLLNALIAGATNNATISIDSVTGLRELLNAVSGAFAFQGECTAEELAEKEKVAGHVWQVGDKEFACNGTDWVELGFNIDLSSYALASDLTDHVGNSDIHVTEEDKTAWNAKVDADTLAAALAGKVDRSTLAQYATDYTSFEVYAHDTRIEAGDLSTQTHANYIGRPGDTIAFAVNPSMVESFILRSTFPQTKQNVIVDWGDGKSTDVSTIAPSSVSGGEYRYTLTHDYTDSGTGTYIVKIFGNTYFSFTSSGSEATSLISRIFEPDLPIARHIWNLSSVLQHSNRLLHVDMYGHAASTQILHWSGGFTSARNLIDCVGFTKYAHRESNYNIFQNCINLVETDLRIADAPADVSTGNGYAFTNCPKLAVDINTLLPVHGFRAGATINVAKLFNNDSALSGIVPADMLWNNTNVTWVNTADAFTDCSVEIRNQVPESWGGLLAPDSDQGTDDL